jgi:hypothetical protein
METQEPRWTYSEIFEEVDKKGELMLTTPERVVTGNRIMDGTDQDESLFLYSLAYIKTLPEYEKEKVYAAESGIGDLEQSPYWLVGTRGTYRPVSDEKTLVAAMPASWNVEEIYRMSPRAYFNDRTRGDAARQEHLRTELGRVHTIAKHRRSARF